MSEHEVLTEVPPQLKRLVRLVARAFYFPLHIVILDILAKYPCVTEGDLVEVLKMHGAQKQLRQALTYLRKDKLINSLQKMESEESADRDKPLVRMIHYYYINYKQFVNVIKYKLDQMRKRIEAEERSAKNRTSYVCQFCESTFSDLDVDKIFDPIDQRLKCSHCGSPLEEDAPEIETVDARTLISRLNEQMRPILDLLRETDNVNLAPEILEPEAQSIEKHLLAKGVKLHGTAGKDQTWTTRKAMDLYGSEQDVHVKIGTQQELNEQNKPVVKERPEWMIHSTVHPSGDLVQGGPLPAEPAIGDVETGAGKSTIGAHQIRADILAHEAKRPELPGPSGVAIGGREDLVGLETAHYSSSSSSEDESMQQEEEGAVWQPATGSPMESEEEDEEDQFTMMIGGQPVALNDVTSEMVAGMTEEERERYTRLCQQAMSDYY